MGRVVLDASVILALFDPHDALHDSSVEKVRQHRNAGATFVMPASVLAEILVGAARRGDDELNNRRAQAIAAFGKPVPLDEDVAVTAAKLRASHRSLRLPDAIVLATASTTEAETVLAGDKKWKHIDPRVELAVAQVTSDEQTSNPETEADEQPQPPT
ncbi:MAG TPA: PIN domain-containing protein [Jiangellaceae bacterium]